MREELKKKIMKNIIKLKSDMDAKDLTDYFIQEEILDFKDVEMINGYNPNTSDSRNTCFFRLICDKPDHAYDVFMNALRANNQGYLADVIGATEVVVQPQEVAEVPGAWIAEIPEESRRRRLTERDLSRIAQCFGSDWENVARELGLSEVNIDHCKMENQNSVTMQVYSALYKWRNKVVNGATLEALVAILVHCNSTKIDWQQLERIARNF